MNAKPTSYQKTHAYTSRVEVKCDGHRNPATGRCEKCGRDISRNVPHNPNQTGSLGWVQTYANGSVLLVRPESN